MNNGGLAGHDNILEDERLRHRNRLTKRILITLVLLILTLFPLAFMRVLGAPITKNIGQFVLGKVGHGAFTATWCALMRHVGWLNHDSTDYTAGLFLSSKIRTVLSWPVFNLVWRLTASYSARDYPYILHRSAWFDSIWNELATTPLYHIYEDTNVNTSQNETESLYYEVVTIGAGYDTRALRLLPGLNSKTHPWLRIWEVDHHALLSHKSNILAANELEPSGCFQTSSKSLEEDLSDYTDDYFSQVLPKAEDDSSQCPALREPLPESKTNRHKLLLHNLRSRGLLGGSANSKNMSLSVNGQQGLMLVLEGVAPFLSCDELQEILSVWHIPGARIVWDIPREVGKICSSATRSFFDVHRSWFSMVSRFSSFSSVMFPWSARSIDSSQQLRQWHETHGWEVTNVASPILPNMAFVEAVAL